MHSADVLELILDLGSDLGSGIWDLVSGSVSNICLKALAVESIDMIMRCQMSRVPKGTSDRVEIHNASKTLLSNRLSAASCRDLVEQKDFQPISFWPSYNAKCSAWYNYR